MKNKYRVDKPEYWWDVAITIKSMKKEENRECKHKTKHTEQYISLDGNDKIRCGKIIIITYCADCGKRLHRIETDR